MNASDGVTVSIEMNREHFARFQELGEKSGVKDPTQLFRVAMDLLEKAVNARRQGHLIGSVPNDAEPGKNGIVEILMSEEILALESAKAPGVVFQ